MKHRLLFLVTLGCLAAPIFAAQPSTHATYHGNRYLFIVDTSASMKRMEETVRTTVHDLVFTGFSGRMHAGDTFGLWTFNEKTYTDFPMQVWTPAQSWNISRDTATFLKAQHYEKESRLDQVVKRMLSVIKSVKDVTIILVTDGSGSLRGTPFDEPINQVYQQEIHRSRRATDPFVTFLLVRQGIIEAWQVQPPGDPIYLPLLPEPEKIAQASPTTVTNALAAKVSPSPSKPNDQPTKEAIVEKSPVATEPPKTVSAPPPPVSTANIDSPADVPEKPKVVKEIKTVSKPAEQTGSPEKAIAPAVEKTNAAAVQIVSTAPTNAPVTALPANPPSEPPPSKSDEVKPASTLAAETAKLKPEVETKATNSVLAMPANTPAVKTPAPPAQAVSPSQIKNSGATAVPVAPGNEVDSSATKTNEPEASAPNLAAAVLPENQLSPAGMLIIAAALLIFACGLGWVLVRRRHAPQPSLISQYMDRKLK